MRFPTLLIGTLLPVLALAQTTTPTDFRGLADGEVRFTPPSDTEWETLPADPAGRMASYQHKDGYAVLAIGTNEQKSPIPNNAETRYQLGAQMAKAIRADLERSGAEILQLPRLQRGDPFVITIRDRMRQDGVTTDRLHLYRAMGYQLVRVSARVADQDPKVVDQVFETAQKLIAGAVIGKRDRKPSAAP